MGADHSHWRTGYNHPYLLRGGGFLSAARAANGTFRRFLGRRGLENRALLTRIGINPEQKIFGGDRPEIDNSTDQRLRCIAGHPEGCFTRLIAQRLGRARRKHQIDCFM